MFKEDHVMKRSVVFVLLLVVLTGIVFTAGQALAQKKQVEIFWHMSEYETWLREKMKPAFEKENPDIELVITFVNDPENEAVLASRLAADNLPDIFAVIGGPAITALEEDMLLDLTQFPQIMENLNHYPDNVFEFPRTVRKYAGLSEEGIYGWPTFKVLTGVFYDKNKIKEAGVEKIPETYDEFWAMLDQIKASGIYRHAVAWGNHRWMVYNNFWQVATALIGPDVSTKIMTGEVKLNSPEMIEVWDYYKRLAEGGYVNPDYKSKEWGLLESDFANLKDGVILQGPWLFNSYVKMNPDIELGVFPFPTKDGENRHWVGFVGDRNWWAAKKPTVDQEAQLKVIKWMTSAEFNMSMLTDANLLPFYEQEYPKTSPVITEMLDQGFPVAPQANNKMDLIIPPGNPGFYNYIWDNLPKLTSCEMSSQEFGDMIEEYYGQFRQ
jgi:raffinose/stachyose/melibiose transport system substrate-binding protein